MDSVISALMDALKTLVKPRMLVLLLLPAIYVTALVLPAVLLAYLNQGLFRYDALAEHASREEFDLIVERAG